VTKLASINKKQVSCTHIPADNNVGVLLMSVGIGANPVYCGTTTGTQFKTVPGQILDDYTAYKRGQRIDQTVTAAGKGFKKLVNKTREGVKSLLAKIPK
jgi:hypothetical protein